MAEIPDGQEHHGTFTVKVLPDLTEFTKIMESVADTGFTVCEETTFTYDEHGQVATSTKVTSVVAGYCKTD